ncbi:MAG: glycosyltransferase family 2 protein, partial [bacterium]|nr:glycosyltransferase family 2 protein [bacterium]
MDVRDKKKKYKISVVVPTLNEEATLDEVLKGVKKYSHELIVIDGHSTDRTREIAQKNKVRFVLDDRKGKGAAIRIALHLARHPIVVFIDADGSHKPSDIPKLVRPIQEDKADLVIGCRMTAGSDELFSDIYQFIRLAGSMIINLAINYRWNVRLTDTQNGFRAILKDMGKHIRMKANTTTIEQEMV